MKLYATTTSERASKGQGGNRYLRTAYQIELESGERKELCVLTLAPSEKGYTIDLRAHHGDSLYHDEYTDETKGNKQKGETQFCNACRRVLPHGDDKACELH